MQGTIITVVGNLTGDPETRFTASGTSVTNFNLAVNNRTKDAAGEWTDGEPTFFRVAAWREYGEHIAESLHKGDQVLVAGKLITRSWEGQDGEKRTSLDITADEVAVTLRWATVKVTKVRGGNDSRPKDATASKDGGFDDAPPF